MRWLRLFQARCSKYFYWQKFLSDPLGARFTLYQLFLGAVRDFATRKMDMEIKCWLSKWKASYLGALVNTLHISSPGLLFQTGADAVLWAGVWLQHRQEPWDSFYLAAVAVLGQAGFQSGLCRGVSEAPWTWTERKSNEGGLCCCSSIDFWHSRYIKDNSDMAISVAFSACVAAHQILNRMVACHMEIMVIIQHISSIKIFRQCLSPYEIFI